MQVYLVCDVGDGCMIGLLQECELGSAVRLKSSSCLRWGDVSYLISFLGSYHLTICLRLHCILAAAAEREVFEA